MPSTTRTGPVGWFLRGGWYVLVVVLSLGILSFVPFVHAALRINRPLMWLWAAVYTGAVATVFVIPTGPAVGGILIGLMVIASVHSLVLRRQVWRSVEAHGPEPLAASSDPAVSALLAARARREEARRLAAADPLMARELRIGRPDLPRTYDDGGLVDLASAPADLIARICDIDPRIAEQITGARANGAYLTTVDDLFAVCDIPYPLWDRIRDRAVVMPG